MTRSQFVSILAVASVATNTAFAAGFPDTRGTDYELAFAYLQEEGIVSGFSDGYGRPNQPLNRVQALKVILEARGAYSDRIADYKKRMPPIPLFSDVDQSQWYGPYLETAFEKGIVTGYPNGTFQPARALSVEEAATMLMRTFGEQGEKSKASLSPYIENVAGQWFTPSINAAINKNLVMHKGKLKLGHAITRGQFFDMVYRLHSTNAIGAVAFDGPEPSVTPRVVAQPQPRYIEYGPTGVTTSTTPQNVKLPQTSSHPNASEQYFAISMPSIGIEDLRITHPQDAVSKEGVLSVLKNGVGHLFSYPGGGGKIMVYGHSSDFPWNVSEFSEVFRKINELAPGDRVYITYAGNLYIYEVTHEQTILAKNASDAFRDNGEGEELILFTCWPPDSIAQRYLVHAVPVDTVALR
tara:strand:+ start:257 stop:1486 length:1230 start_codon:yes stop_codon:yes gene_type:complete